MEIIKFNPVSVLASKNGHQKFVKVCNLFTSKVELVSGKSLFDVKADTTLIERLNFNESGTLRISGDDESQAASLIKKCISYSL